MPVRSWKTTVSGVVVAVGVLLVAVIQVVKGQDLDIVELGQLAGVLLIAVGAVVGGVTARDDAVSSEGTTAPKALKLPDDEP